MVVAPSGCRLTFVLSGGLAGLGTSLVCLLIGRCSIECVALKSSLRHVLPVVFQCSFRAVRSLGWFTAVVFACLCLLGGPLTDARVLRVCGPFLFGLEGSPGLHKFRVPNGGVWYPVTQACLLTLACCSFTGSGVVSTGCFALAGTRCRAVICCSVRGYVVHCCCLWQCCGGLWLLRGVVGPAWRAASCPEGLACVRSGGWRTVRRLIIRAVSLDVRRWLWGLSSSR